MLHLKLVGLRQLNRLAISAADVGILPRLSLAGVVGAGVAWKALTFPQSSSLKAGIAA